MVLVPVTCPYCHSDQVIKGGQTETGKQRYRCQQTTCPHRSFVLEPAYNGRLPQVKEQSSRWLSTAVAFGIRPAC
jgi:transposase-like protein